MFDGVRAVYPKNTLTFIKKHCYAAHRNPSMDHIADHVKAFSTPKDWFSLPDYITCRILINMENVHIILSSELSSGHGMSRRTQAIYGIRLLCSGT